jgi:nicotinamidase-related amidase
VSALKSALVVIDYQKDFVDGALGFPGAELLDAGIAARIDREPGVVIFTFDTHGEDYMNRAEGKLLPVPHCLLGSPGWAFYGKTGERKPDRSFEKPTFGSLELANYLREQKFDRVELCGLVSHICVISNAVLAKAALPEAEIVVDARLTDGYDKKLHEATLDILKNLHITVINTGENNKCLN